MSPATIRGADGCYEREASSGLSIGCVQRLHAQGNLIADLHLPK